MKQLTLTVLLLIVAGSTFAATPLHHYTFNDGGVVDSVGSANGTLINGAFVTGGKLSLDGTDDFVQFNQKLIPSVGSFSVAFFAQQLSLQSSHMEIISQGLSGGPGFYIGHDTSHNFRIGDTWISTGVPFPSDGLLHHYAVTADATDVKLYVDGLLVASKGSALGLTSVGTDTRLGRQFDPFSEYFHGRVDELWIFNGALTAGEVAALAAVPAPPICDIQPPAGLVSWWPGDGNASDIQDGNNGTLFGGLGFATGLVGQAFSFDGVDDHVRVSSSPSLNVQSLTIDAWIFPTDLSIGRPIVEYAPETGPAGVHLWLSVPPQGGTVPSPGALFANIRDTAAGNHNMGSAPNVLSVNQWNHVALTYDKNTGIARLYANGTIVAEANLGTTFTPQTAVPLFFGFRPIGSSDLLAGRRFVGKIDEIDMYNRALSTSEIQAIFNAGSAGKCKVVCNIQLNQTTFVNGDQVIAQVARLANLGPNPVPVEVKLWFELPGSPPPVPFLTVGAEGSFVLPSGFSQDFGPLILATVQASFPRGQYSFNCRLLHAVTGAPLGEDFNPFQLQ